MYEVIAPWELILGSASPRRRQLLQAIGLEFQVQPVDIEEGINQARSLGREAQRLALLKGLAFGPLTSGQALLTADTLVGVDGRILGKPDSREQAVEMLALLSGRSHQVATGFSMIAQDDDQQWMESGYELTEVTFRALSALEIRAYVDSNECMDKAGAYGAQQKGAALVERINGSFYNVIGLPLAKVIDKLMRYQIIAPRRRN
jgi:septum formation protein